MLYIYLFISYNGFRMAYQFSVTKKTTECISEFCMSSYGYATNLNLVFSL